MRIRNQLLSLAAMTLIAVPAAQAEVYFGASVSNSSYDYENVDNSNGWKAFGGVRLDNGLYFEAQYHELGTADVSDQPFELEFTSAAAFIGYQGRADRFGFFGKVGLHNTTTELRSTRGWGSEEEDSTGLALGVGLSFAFNKYLALRGELDGLMNVKDFSDSEDSSVWSGSLGLEARF